MKIQATFAKTKNLRAYPTRHEQRGAVLVFCLIFLLILTVMAVTGMESSVLEERMSGNLRDQSTAFQAAESSLKAAENWLDGQIELPDTSNDGSTVVWARDSMDPDSGDGKLWWQDGAVNGSWWNGKAISLSGFSAVSAQPGYIIEHLLEATAGQSIAIGNGDVPLPRVFHRITSRSEGATSSAEVTLQSTFVKYYE